MCRLITCDCCSIFEDNVIAFKSIGTLMKCGCCSRSSVYGNCCSCYTHVVHYISVNRCDIIVLPGQFFISVMLILSSDVACYYRFNVMALNVLMRPISDNNFIVTLL